MRGFIRVFGVMLVAVGLSALPTAAFASATVVKLSTTFTVDPFPVDDTCAGLGVVGILTGTVTMWAGGRDRHRLPL
jgi:hypothetical protein